MLQLERRVFVYWVKLRDEAFVPGLLCGNVEVSVLERLSALRRLFVWRCPQPTFLLRRRDPHLSPHVSLQFDLFAGCFLHLSSLGLIDGRSVQATILLSLLLPLDCTLGEQPPPAFLQIGLIQYSLTVFTHQIIFFINKPNTLPLR